VVEYMQRGSAGSEAKFSTKTKHTTQLSNSVVVSYRTQLTVICSGKDNYQVTLTRFVSD
jgi:hypothetical protein